MRVFVFILLVLCSYYSISSEGKFIKKKLLIGGAVAGAAGALGGAGGFLAGSALPGLIHHRPVYHRGQPRLYRHNHFHVHRHHGHDYSRDLAHLGYGYGLGHYGNGLYNLGGYDHPW
ncbi:hypothetical protein BIW11_11926 [Tropilaelaps mercedesae]|uniref:Uncharacterized protein n=1 Tax=Tropilaelaps mercedesae TaxID=418985 RepID=A0A1V9X8V7_9ACAR|nr:hypothetical protein BIW11_11926 [Tropilaelaps mercedesae]